MVGWHHQLSGHESEQTPEVGEEQGSLARCSPRGRKESDTTQLLNNNNAVCVCVCVCVCVTESLYYTLETNTTW